MDIVRLCDRGISDSYNVITVSAILVFKYNTPFALLVMVFDRDVVDFVIGIIYICNLLSNVSSFLTNT